MRFLLVKRAQHLKGKIVLLGDKSIANRSIIISAISQGKTTIENFPTSKDCLYTIKAFKKLGIKIIQNSTSRQYKNARTITVFGEGLYGLKKPKSPIFVGDSGTTLRLTLGVLAGQNFAVTLTAGKSLSQRPMLRVTAPLRLMGAFTKSKIQISKSKKEEYPPITIKGGNLKSITYRMPVASAQVKSAILFAGLYTEGTTKVIEPIKTRDHTERMLRLFKAEIKVKQNTIVIKGNKELVSPERIFIPGDISSASFFIVLATILPGSRILIKNVNLNPGRIGIIKVLKRMGADIEIQNSATNICATNIGASASSCGGGGLANNFGEPKSNGSAPLTMALKRSRSAKIQNYEPMGDLIVKSSSLKGTVVKKEEIPSLIDELPILMVAACYARGKTIFDGVGELRVKETDRIRSVSCNLRKMGAQIRILKTAKSEKVVIEGGRDLKGAKVESFGDHRTAMSMVIAALRAQGNTKIDNITCINKSFPNFLSLLKALIH